MQRSLLLALKVAFFLTIAFAARADEPPCPRTDENPSGSLNNKLCCQKHPEMTPIYIQFCAMSDFDSACERYRATICNNQTMNDSLDGAADGLCDQDFFFNGIHGKPGVLNSAFGEASPFYGRCALSDSGGQSGGGTGTTGNNGGMGGGTTGNDAGGAAAGGKSKSGFQRSQKGAAKSGLMQGQKGANNGGSSKSAMKSDSGSRGAKQLAPRSK
jgi:hypothetical protein